MPIAKPECQNCFYAREGEISPDLQRPINCHYKPPKVFILPGPQGQPVNMSVFPAVQPVSWCGQWKQKGPDLKLT